MNNQVRFLLLGTLALTCCSQKPKPVAKSEEAPSAVAQAESPHPSEDSLERHRMLIEQLLNQAFRPVYFPYDQSELSEKSKTLLSQAGALMKQEPSIQVLIKGNTDERGSEDYNIALGDRRARAVKEYLASYGVPASRLKLISYGEEKPAKPGHDESAWALNRRDDFNVTF